MDKPTLEHVVSILAMNRVKYWSTLTEDEYALVDRVINSILRDVQKAGNRDTSSS